MEWCKVFFILNNMDIYIFIDLSLSGIMTSKHVIRESESPWPNGLVDSDFTNDAFLGHYSILISMAIHSNQCELLVS